MRRQLQGALSLSRQFGGAGLNILAFWLYDLVRYDAVAS
jgi:hypothetical protein